MKPSKIIGPIEIYETQHLGSGLTGKVFKGKLRNSNSLINLSTLTQIQLAVKIIPHYQRYENQVTQYLFESEKQALTTLIHPNIVKCFGIYQDGRNSYLATQYLNGGTLKQYMSQKGIHFFKQGKINQKQAVCLFKKLLSGLYHLTSKGFVHRDLKPANIMIKQIFDSKTNEKTLHPVIIDFGFAERIHCIWKPQIFYNVGSPSYMAPQSYNYTKYSQKSDLWALGVIFYQILTGESFDFSMKIQEFFNFTAEAIEKRLNDKKSQFSVRCMKILRNILIVNQNSRLKVNEAIGLVEKLENQLETYNLIKKKNLLTSMQNQTVKLYQKIIEPVNKKNIFFEVKTLKTRQRTRIPSFLDKSNRQQKSQTIQKLSFDKSPRNQFIIFPKRQTDNIKKIKSQQFIKHTPLQNKIQRSTVLSHNKSIEFQSNGFLRKNPQYMSLSIVNKSTNSGPVYDNSYSKNPEVKNFERFVFNYKPSSSQSFHNYLSPKAHQGDKTGNCFVSLG